MPNMGSPQPSTLPSLPNNALGLGLSANTSPFPNTMNQQQHLSMVLGATTQANPQWPLSYAVPFQQQFPNMNNMNLPLAQNLWQSPGFPMFPNTLPTPHSHGHGFPNTTSPDLAHQQLSQAFVGMDHQVSSYPQNFLMANAGENDEMSGYSSPNPQPNYHESQRQHQHVRQ
ncbi:hypothetical protein BT69DRAFT_270592 [Atractiella rhizophila]|nr:hypothetical protein BT69DRAFT_270592 [Atractiella rhizophila]